MQQVSASSILLSQDADISSKDISNQTTSSEKGSDFSSFFEQHMDKESNKQSQQGMTERESKIEHKSKAATNEQKADNSGKNDHPKASTDEENSLTHEATIENEILQDQHNVEQISDNEPAELAPDVAKNAKSGQHSESLKESEQFISLLYNADNTLKKQEQSSPKLDESELDSKFSNDGAAKDNSKDLKGESDKHTLKSFVEGMKGEAQSPTTKAQLPQNGAIEQLEQNATKNVEGKPITSNGMEAKQKLEHAPLNPILKDVALHQKQAEAIADYLNKEEIADTATQHKASEKLIKLADSVLSFNENMQVTNKNNSVNQAELSVDERLTLSATQLASLQNSENNKHTGLPKSHDEITLIKAQNAIQSSGTVLPEAAKAAAIGNKTDDQQQLAATLANLSPHDDDLVSSINNESNSKSVTGKDALAQSVFNNTVKQVKPESQQIVQSSKTNEVVSSSKENAAIEDAITQVASEELSSEKMTLPVENITKNITNKNEVNPATLFSFNRNAMASSSSTLENYNNFVAQQASEVLNHNVASDTAQIQKSNVQLHQETISIFRKDFADAVKDKVMLVISQKLQQFDISLDPPEFGNMQVRVNLQGEQAAVNFIVQNQQAKDALEQNMHKLKDMLAEQGVDVGGANVEQQSKQDGETEQGQLSHQAQNGFATQDADDAVEHILSPNLVDSSAMSVDYYA